jgi:hypothetical protein
MVLAELRDFLQQRQRVALSELISHFAVDAEAMRGMLALWQRKGRLRKVSKTAQCGTQCCQCDTTLTEIYEWLDDKT